MKDPLIDLLAEVSASFQTRLSHLPMTQEIALAPFQLRLLALIARFPGSSQQKLGTMLARDKGQIARAIKELEAHGLIRREASTSDWRSQVLLLTPQGEEIARQAARRRADLGAYALQDLSPETRDVTTDALRRILARLQEG